ncbi:MAG: hypothetical protein KAS94_11165 [Desulfobulbaceae bacterium]|nr:hypothetical protein [Desulfobulbaceae bacterium]
MKKALSFAVALGLVAGMATTAVAADLVLKGDARLRGVYKNNTVDLDDSTADKIQNLDQRYRINADIIVNDAVKINTRLVLADQKFGNNQPAATTLTTTGASEAVALDHTHDVDSSSDTHTVDRFNMVIKDVAGGTLSLGRMNAGWGNKFLGWGSSVDRIKYIAKAGDITYGGYLQKNAEGLQADGDGDNDTFGALVIGKAGDSKYGVLANYIYADTKTNDGASETGYMVDVFFNTKAGPANIMSELVFKGGDAADNPTGDDYYGGFVGASMGINDQISAKALFAFYDGNMGDSSPKRDCDNDFAPTLLIGTCSETAVFDFGGSTDSTDDMTYMLTVGADMKVSDTLSFGAGLAYVLLSEEGGLAGDEDATMTEIDLSMKYALAQNTTYSLGIALGQVDTGIAGASEDDMFVVGNRVDVKF